MANNDFVIIDGIIDDLLEKDNIKNADGTVRGVYFERLAISELLKTYDLSAEQLDNGLVDGGDDGDIDGFYIFVNGNYLSDIKSFYWPRENGKLEIYLITCKHHNTYELSPLESMDASLSELLDFSISAAELKRSYNNGVLEKRESPSAFVSVAEWVIFIYCLACQVLVLTTQSLHSIGVKHG